MAAAFLSTFTVFGVAYSFGAFFSSMADEFGTDRSETSFFFALTTFLYFALGLVTGPVADRVGPRPVLLAGTVSMVVGLIATSRVSSIEAGYLTYGLGVGFAVACGYVPLVAAVGGWFNTQRTTALGVAVAGIGVGTLTNAPLAEWLIDRYDWRRTYVIMAIGGGVIMLIAAALARRPPRPAQDVVAPKLTKMITTADFGWLYASILCLALILFVPFVYLGDYLGSTGSTRSAGLLVGIIGLSSVLGRLGLGRLAARFPPLRLYQGSILGLALSFLIWLVADASYPLLFIFAIVFGTTYGGFIALCPAVAAAIWGANGLGGLLGALYTAAGVGGLIGPPLMGRLIDATGYPQTILIATGLGIVSFLCLLPVRLPARQ